MNISTVMGLFCSLLVIVASIAGYADQIGVLFDPVSMVIVVGGTIAATLVSFDWADISRAFRHLFVVLKKERSRTKRDINDLITVAKYYAQGNFVKIADALESIENPFLRLGVELATDDTAKDEDIVDVMRWRMEKMKHKEQADVAVFRAMGLYAPAFGMLGTLFGLVFMLTGLGNDDFRQIGASLATALMTTLYGLILAYMLFKPIASKLETRTLRRLALMHMIFEGVLLIRQKRSPTVVRETLRSFIAELDDELLSEHHLPHTESREEKVHAESEHTTTAEEV